MRDEQGEEELVCEFSVYLGQMLLGALSDVVLGYDLCVEFLQPFLFRILINFRQHLHVGDNHFGFKVVTFSDRGGVMSAEEENPVHGCGPEVNQQTSGFHHFCVDAEKVIENRFDKFGMRLDEFVHTFHGSYSWLLIILDQLDSLGDEELQNSFELLHQFLIFNGWEEDG